MDTFDKPSNLNLPPPVVETGPLPFGEPEPQPAGAGRPEKAPNPELASAPPAAPVAGVPVPVSTVPQQSDTATNDVPTTTPVNAPATAADKDRIEKEWVIKAKQIVERTKDNPHEQSREMSAYKADYLQKRYNKSLKLSG